MTTRCDIHPDSEILEAFEKVRSHRAWAYSFDDIPPEGHPAAIEAADEEMVVHERRIRTGAANSIAAVLARLQLAVPSLDSSRFVDITLMRDGPLALYSRHPELNEDARQVLFAIHELIAYDWAEALAGYEAAAANFADLLSLKSFVDAERFRDRKGGVSNAFAEAVNERLEGLECRLDDSPQLDRLMRTPAPDWQAYKRKAEICIKEGVANEAAEWLLKDANALIAARAEESRS